MTTNTTLAIALLLLTTATSALAIDQEGGIRFLVADPTGAFDEAADDLGFGVALHYGVRPSRAFTVGVGLHAMTYGSETTEYDLPLVEEFDLETRNNLAGGFLFARWRPIDGVLQPYAEARAGLNYLWTESELEDEDWWNDDGIARETNYDDFATFWSAGGGLLIRLSSGDRTARKPGVYLDLAVTHVEGGKAEYLTEGAIEIVDDESVYSPTESQTDLTTYELGVVLTF
jgi:hypothetical protein